jgi:hypothetical protein
MSHDYIPGGDAGFDIFFNNLVEYVDQKTGGNAPEWNHILPAARAALQGARNTWEAAYGPVKSPHTPVQTEAKNDAKKAAKALIRPFVNQYLRYLPVTNEDRTAMNIPNKDTIPIPVPPPQAQAEADIAFPGYTWWSWQISGPSRAARLRTSAVTTGYGYTLGFRGPPQSNTSSG